MSEIEQIQSIVDIASKPNQKTDNKKVMTLFICFCIFAFPILILLGIDVGKWESWRDEITTWKVSTDAKINDLQNKKNEQTAEKIKNIKIKTDQ